MQCYDTGYRIGNTEGLRYTLQSRGMNVPVITTLDAFKAFIDTTPMMTRALAIIEHHSFIPEEPYASRDPLFYAVIYEKRKDSNALFIYNTQRDVRFDLSNIHQYFDKDLFLFLVNENRGLAEMSALYAIQDAKHLIPFVNIALTDCLNLTKQCNRLHLDNRFIYNKNALMQDHVETMISMYEALMFAKCRFSIYEKHNNTRPTPTTSATSAPITGFNFSV